MKLYRLLPDGRRQITGFVYPGDFLGLANNGEHAYTAEALSDISLCKFKRGQLENLFDDFPKLKDYLLGISRRIGRCTSADAASWPENSTRTNSLLYHCDD